MATFLEEARQRLPGGEVVKNYRQAIARTKFLKRLKSVSGWAGTDTASQINFSSDEIVMH
jgi:hypothetical protein